MNRLGLETVSSIKLEYTENGKGVLSFSEPNSPEEYEHTITKLELIPEKLKCSNKMCPKGYYDIGAKIRELVRDKVKFKKSAILCSGREGSEKLKRTYRRCGNTLSYRISLLYYTENA